MENSTVKNNKEFSWENELFKVSIFEIVLAAIFLSIHIVIVYFANFTILRIIPIRLEFIMYIFYGLIFAAFKGSILSILSDTLVLLLTGRIGTWFWLYAIVPPLISIVSYLYYLMFKRTKITRFVLAYTLTLLSFLLAAIVYLKHSDPNGSFKLSKKVSIGHSLILALIALYGFLSLILTSVFTILYLVHKNEKWNYYILVTSLILFISVVFRWVLDPINFIEYYNHFRGSKTGKLKQYGVDYIILFTKIVIKDLFVIPIYIIVLSPVFTVISILKQNYVDNTRKIKY
ncbi:hypothetical protein EG856_00695 [Mycoplasmopsis phocirhinis]|uniref:ECF transporter S component n=1 Tax=Mycoplasmopsis phocirhinis TaxID=142650 RepID=A0A4P6MNJ0_9BACT|nr:hypothetical protein [Mycoplasmopsis phocirhinis]QBF34450.1 hypothetical protein EG856_00695 [Mycoplasmopsis phocirhinis]